MILISIDPGKTTGWAVFENGVLAAAYVASWTTTFQWMKMNRLFDRDPDEVLGELPCVYPGPQPSDPNDLIQVAEQLGELLSLYRARGCNVSTVAPRTWKGTVPKDKHQPRILSKLTPAELALVPKMPRAKRPEHNAVDSVGLGLWKLGRLHG